MNEPTSAPTKTPVPTKADNITVDNNSDFASLMQIIDITDVETIGNFVHSHRGDTIEFDGSVIVMAHHEDYNTRFDVWIVGGDYDLDRIITGPLFMFENVNYYDMNVSGTDSVEEMKNFHIVAEITGFVEESCYISLEPISMTYRESKNSSEYEKAFVRELNGYSIYYLFDTDKQEVVYFVTNDTYVDKGTYSGEFSSGVTIAWNHGQFTEKFIHAGGTKATLIDGNNFEWEYKLCDVSEAEIFIK